MKAYRPPATFVSKDREIRINGPMGLAKAVMETGSKGLDIQHYKDLGEMRAEQLWKTTLDPNARTPAAGRGHPRRRGGRGVLDPDGRPGGPRRDFIRSNALNVANLDV